MPRIKATGAQSSLLGPKGHLGTERLRGTRPHPVLQSLLISIPTTGPHVVGVSPEVGPGQAACLRHSLSTRSLLWWPPSVVTFHHPPARTTPGHTQPEVSLSRTILLLPVGVEGGWRVVGGGWEGGKWHSSHTHAVWRYAGL